mmetsp:Transcript_8215/g.11737  ORF Transcript_8215/g.11737 Transcript_8215/m.11737 type:complete len:111 (+) Transcript_8215:223-555(+)
MKIKEKKYQRMRDAKLLFMISNLLILTSTSVEKIKVADQDREFNIQNMFSFTRDILKTSDSRKAFERTFMEEEKSHDNPDDIFSQKTLEMCYKEVMKEILPKRAVIKQTE